MFSQQHGKQDQSLRVGSAAMLMMGVRGATFACPKRRTGRRFWFREGRKKKGSARVAHCQSSLTGWPAGWTTRIFPRHRRRAEVRRWSVSQSANQPASHPTLTYVVCVPRMHPCLRVRLLPCAVLSANNLRRASDEVLASRLSFHRVVESAIALKPLPLLPSRTHSRVPDFWFGSG